MTRRDPTSDADLDAALMLAAPLLRYSYCRDAGWIGSPNGVSAHWQQTVPAHIAIAALVREVQTLLDHLGDERRARHAAEAAVRRLTDGAQAVIDQAAELDHGEQLELP